MAHLVNLDAVARRHAERWVLSGVTLGIDDGDRVGVIGRNGSGKSTLLRLVAGADEPDEGRVTWTSQLRLGFVPQEPVLDPGARVLDAVLDGRWSDSEQGWELERRARALLDRLGVADVSAALGTLSGGQRKRVALARGLAPGTDLLVLDEPTNHLDVDVVEWLEGHLLARRGALVLVTHDRYLLDRLATRTVEVIDGRLETGYGSYSDYLEARAVREEQAAAAERRQQNRARVELAWLRRGARARTSKSKLRVDAARDLLTSGPAPEPDTDLALPSRRLGTKVVELRAAGKRYGDRWVLRGVDLSLLPGARVGVVGPNGAGKTTLLALVAGRLAPDEGEVEVGETVAVGWYGQDPEPLPPAQRVLDVVDEVARETVLPDGRRVGASHLLERFAFPAVLQRSRVGELSGGERRRLELLRVLAGTPNVLLLDEPTNDLDLDTLEILEEFLDSWRGALVVASHDRYFLDRVCSDLHAVEGASVRHHPGGWSAWRTARADQARVAAPARGGPPATSPPPRPRRLGYAERRELAALEHRLHDLEARKAELASALADAGGDHRAAGAVGEELAGVLAALEGAESRWLELAEIGEA